MKWKQSNETTFLRKMSLKLYKQGFFSSEWNELFKNGGTALEE